MNQLRQNPYRVFFPLGIVAGLIGVGHWLFWSLGWVTQSRPFMHASLQAQGFLGCFAVGFLMTAVPRFLGGGLPATMPEVLLVLSFMSTTIIGSSLGAFGVSQIAFCLLLGVMVLFVARRWSLRRKNPPPSFVLIPIGMLHAFIGTGLILMSGIGHRSWNLFHMGSQMMQVGFMLCLVLGMTALLCPYLMGYAPHPADSENANAAAVRTRRLLLVHAVTGWLVFESFLLELNHPRFALWLRAIVTFVHMLYFARIGRRVVQREIYRITFWFSCWMVPLGLILAATSPQWRVAGLHVLFIGGFSLMIFSFAIMVIFSHGPRPHLLSCPMKLLGWIAVATVVSAVLRGMADIDTVHYKLWIHMAAGTWLVGALTWLIWVLPDLVKPAAGENQESG